MALFKHKVFHRHQPFSREAQVRRLRGGSASSWTHEGLKELRFKRPYDRVKAFVRVYIRSRSCQRRMMPSKATLITPISCG